MPRANQQSGRVLIVSGWLIFTTNQRSCVCSMHLVQFEYGVRACARDTRCLKRGLTNGHARISLDFRAVYLRAGFQLIWINMYYYFVMNFVFCSVFFGLEGKMSQHKGSYVRIYNEFWRFTRECCSQDLLKKIRYIYSRYFEEEMKIVKAKFMVIFLRNIQQISRELITDGKSHHIFGENLWSILRLLKMHEVLSFFTRHLAEDSYAN